MKYGITSAKFERYELPKDNRKSNRGVIVASILLGTLCAAIFWVSATGVAWL
jgi:hypothetical protein